MVSPGKPKQERTRARVRGSAGRREAAEGEVEAATAAPPAGEEATEEAGGGGGEEEKAGRKGAAEEATHLPLRPASPA